MIHIKQYILTLVALIAMATQAWATGPEKVTQFTKELIADWKDVDVNVTLDDMQKIGLEATDATTAQAWTDVPANGQAYLFFNFQGGKITYVFFENGHVKDVPSDFITKKQIYDIVKGGMMCFYTGAPPTPFPITWDATSRNTASIAAMPAGNVEVNVEYYPQAALTTVPSAKSGVLATTDDDIISAGTVAAIGSTETKQGTLLYHFSYTKLSDAALEFLTDADWSTDVPKATNITEAGTYYVYYYVKGNVGQTDDTIFSDGDYNDQQTGNLPIEVEIGEAPTYAVRLNTEGLDAEEAAKWKAAKGDDNPAAFPLKGVKRYDDITVTYTGTRKVIGVKAEKKVTPILDLSTISGSSYTVTDDVILTGTPSANLEITVNGNCEITLDNVNPSGTKHIVIDVPSNNLNIKLKGTSRLKRLILSEALAIDEAESDGTVIVFSEYIPLKGSTVTINGGTVKAKSTNDSSFAVLGNLTVNGGNVYIATNNGQAVNGTVTVGTGVTLYESDGSTWGAITSGSETNMPYLSTDNSTDPSQWTW